MTTVWQRSLIKKDDFKEEEKEKYQINEQNEQLFRTLGIATCKTAIIKFETIDNEFKLFIPVDFKENYETLDTVSGIINNILNFLNYIGKKVIGDPKEYAWTTLFGIKSTLYCTPFDTYFTIYDLRFFYFHKFDPNVNKYPDTETPFKTQLPEELIKMGSDINVNFNEIGNITEYYLIDRTSKYLKARFIYNDKLNEYIYTNIIEFEKIRKSYMEYYKNPKNKDKVEKNALLILNYLMEKPLTVTEICAYFEVDLNSVIKLYMNSYDSNAFKIIYDFYDKILPETFSKYIINNIQNVTKFLYFDYSSYVSRDKVFLALFCIMTCVSKTGLYLLMNFLKDSLMTKTNEIILDDIDYTRLNVLGLDTINKFYTSNYMDIDNEIKVLATLPDQHQKQKIIQIDSNSKVSEKGQEIKIPEFEKKKVPNKEYDVIKTDLKLGETYILEIEKQKALLLVESNRKESLENRLNKDVLNKYVLDTKEYYLSAGWGNFI